MHKVALLSKGKRGELFAQTASQMGTTNADYDNAKPGTLKLLPPVYRLGVLKKDYVAMSHMIFDKHLEFDEIVEILAWLEGEINL